MRRNTRAEQERQTRVSDLQNDIVLWLNERQAAEQKPDLDRSAILRTAEYVYTLCHVLSKNVSYILLIFSNVKKCLLQRQLGVRGS